MNKEFCDNCLNEIKADSDDGSLILYDPGRIELNTFERRLVFCSEECLRNYLMDNGVFKNDENKKEF